MSHQDAANTRQTEYDGAPTGARCAPTGARCTPIAVLVARQQRAVQLALPRLEAGHASAPALSVRRHHLAKQSKGILTVETILSLARDAQKRVPAVGLDGFREPFRIQPPIREDDDRPVRGHRAF